METTTSNNEIGATIESVVTDVTSTSEDFDLLFKTMSAGTTANEKLRITSDGRLYGTSIHNNAGAVTGTTNQYIASGTYTPTLTNVANVTLSQNYPSQWIRVGNVVTVSGAIGVTITTNGIAVIIRFTLPIPSSISGISNIAGVACDNENHAFSIYPDTVNDEAFFEGSGVVQGIFRIYFYNFSYIIL